MFKVVNDALLKHHFRRQKQRTRMSTLFCQINSTFFKQSSKNVELIWQKRERDGRIIWQKSNILAGFRRAATFFHELSPLNPKDLARPLPLELMLISIEINTT
jgi:hypothetical protein